MKRGRITLAHARRAARAVKQKPRRRITAAFRRKWLGRF